MIYIDHLILLELWNSISQNELVVDLEMDKKLYSQSFGGEIFIKWQPRRTWQDDTKIDVMEIDCKD